LTPEEVIEDALHYFGPGSTGLALTSQTSQPVRQFMARIGRRRWWSTWWQRWSKPPAPKGRTPEPEQPIFKILDN
jgi:hypothetical protein